MKKNLFLLLFMGFGFNNCKTQNKTNFLRSLDYQTIAYNRIDQITTEKDTLVITESRFFTVTKKIKYLIETTETRGDLLMIYTKLENIEVPKSNYDFKKPAKPYSLFVLSFSNNKDKMYVLEENKLWYGSLNDCKSANMDSSFKNKYFFTYFSTPYFDSFKKLQNFDNIDSATVKAISDNWWKDVESNGNKCKNTQTAYGYGVNVGEDMLNIILINHNINPIGTDLSSFSKKVEYYHIKPLDGSATRHYFGRNRINVANSSSNIAPPVEAKGTGIPLSKDSLKSKNHL